MEIYAKRGQNWNEIAKKTINWKNNVSKAAAAADLRAINQGA